MATPKGARRADNQTIPAIETRFDSILFRSLREARYAVFFDVLGLEYQYEPEKFDTSDGRYIPDFFLPGIGDEDDSYRPTGAYIEIKGVNPTPEQCERMKSLWEQTEKENCILGPDIGVGWGIREEDETTAKFISQCALCGQIGISHAGFSSNGDPMGPSGFCHGCWPAVILAREWGTDDYFMQDYPITDKSPLILLAHETAKSARFESEDWRKQTLPSAIEFGRKLRDWKVYCAGDRHGTIISILREWAVGLPGYREHSYHKRLEKAKGSN